MKVLRKNGETAEVSFEEREGREAFWHTSALMLAQAVKRLYPETKCAAGAAAENGFYYDFDFGFPFSEECRRAVEDEMKKIIRESLSLQVYEQGREEASADMEARGEDYKLELVRELAPDEKAVFSRLGEYAELCGGPNIANVSRIKAVKLLSVAVAYWKGDERNRMLTRIY